MRGARGRARGGRFHVILSAPGDTGGPPGEGRPGLTDHVMSMRRGPSLEPRRKLGASYGKETRNGDPYNVSACDGPRGHTHVHHRWSVALALSRIFRIFLVTVSTRVYRHVISQPRPSPFLRRHHLPRKSKRARNGEGLGPRLCL